FLSCVVLVCLRLTLSFCFCVTAPASAEIYTLSLHDALPIFAARAAAGLGAVGDGRYRPAHHRPGRRVDAAQRNRMPHRPHRAHQDRKSTRLNSSHVKISYAVFCLKKKNITTKRPQRTD